MKQLFIFLFFLLGFGLFFFSPKAYAATCQAPICNSGYEYSQSSNNCQPLPLTSGGPVAPTYVTCDSATSYPACDLTNGWGCCPTGATTLNECVQVNSTTTTTTTPPSQCQAPICDTGYIYTSHECVSLSGNIVAPHYVTCDINSDHPVCSTGGDGCCEKNYDIPATQCQPTNSTATTTTSTTSAGGGTGGGIGTLGTPLSAVTANPGCGTGQTPTLDCIFPMIANIIYWAIMLAFVVAVFLIIYAGIRLTTSGGDSKAVMTARNTLIFAIAGLVLILVSFFILNFIGYVTGVACIDPSTPLSFSACSESGGGGAASVYTCSPTCVSPQTCQYDSSSGMNTCK